jgi:hypothetical protein
LLSFPYALLSGFGYDRYPAVRSLLGLLGHSKSLTYVKGRRIIQTPPRLLGVSVSCMCPQIVL